MNLEKQQKVLLAHILNKDLSYIYANPELQLSSIQLEAYNNYLNRLNNGEPIAYILGKQAFWDFEVSVNPKVLIPRIDSEILIEAITNTLNKNFNGDILDLGTGSGILAIALAKIFNNNVYALDNSIDAILLAKSNSTSLNLNINFIVSNWFASIKHKFDLIVANPPYIAKDDPEIDTQVVNFEPNNALFAENNGLKDLQQIISNAPCYLNKNGALWIEHGYKQGPIVSNMFQQAGFSNINTIKDLQSLERVTSGVWY